MGLLIGFACAWVAVLLAIILSSKYFVRKGYQKKWSAGPVFARLNKVLKTLHIPLGIAFIAVGLLHGLLSTVPILSLNMGTLCWITALLFGLTYIFRKRLSKRKPWIIVHRTLAIVMAGFLVWHVVDVGGVKIIEVFAFAMERAQNAPVPDPSALQTPPESPAPSDSSADPALSFPLPNAVRSALSLDEVTLRDGVYTGTGDGFRDTITVAVTVTDGVVTDIKLKEVSDDYVYYMAALEDITREVFDNNTVTVTAVSGATSSSRGIIQAITEAVEQAVVPEDGPSG